MGRPDIPDRVKAEVWANQDGICTDCKEPIEPGTEEYHHTPPLGLRLRDASYKDTHSKHYIPNANDPEFISAKHPPCHLKHTFGHGTYRGDVTEIARTKKGLKKRAETDKPKKKWGSRPLRSNPIIAGSKNSKYEMKWDKASGRWKPRLRQERGTKNVDG
jgi:hypothetical protein